MSDGRFKQSEGQINKCPFPGCEATVLEGKGSGCQEHLQLLNNAIGEFGSGIWGDIIFNQQDEWPEPAS